VAASSISLYPAPRATAMRERSPYHNVIHRGRLFRHPACAGRFKARIPATHHWLGDRAGHQGEGANGNLPRNDCLSMPLHFPVSLVPHCVTDDCPPSTLLALIPLAPSHGKNLSQHQLGPSTLAAATTACRRAASKHPSLFTHKAHFSCYNPGNV
jgi:hypothetical protein